MILTNWMTIFLLGIALINLSAPKKFFNAIKTFNALECNNIPPKIELNAKIHALQMV